MNDIKVILDNEILYERNIYLDQNIHKKGIIDYFNESFKNMFASVYSVI